MEKKYKHKEVDPEPKVDAGQKNVVREPALKYGIPAEINSSPPLTEEELADSISGDELLEHIYQYIDKLFDNK